MGGIERLRPGPVRALRMQVGIDEAQQVGRAGLHPVAFGIQRAGTDP